MADLAPRHHSTQGPMQGSPHPLHLPGDTALKSSESTSLRGAAAPSPLAQVQSELREWASLRGSERGRHALRVVPPEEDERLHALARAVARHLPLHNRRELRDSLRHTYDLARLEAIRERLEQESLGVGIRYGRNFDDAAIAEARRSLDTSLTTTIDEHRDLFERHPHLAPRLMEHSSAIVRDGMELVQHAERGAITISVALRRIVPQMEAALNALSDRSSGDIELLDRAFQERYGRSVIEEFRALCRRPGFGVFFPAARIERRVNAYLQGDRIAVGAEELLALFVTPRARHYERARNLLVSFAREGLSKVALRYNEIVSGRTPRFDALATRFRGERAAVIRALTEGDVPRALAIDLRRALRGGAREVHTALELLRALPAPLVDELLDTYRRSFGGSLQEDVERASKVPPPLRERFLSWLAVQSEHARGASTPEAAADYTLATLECALHRIGPHSVTETLLDLPLPERRSVRAAYTAKHGRELTADLGRYRIPRRERYSIEAALRDQELSDAELIYQCVAGIGTDVEGLKRILRHKRTDELSAIDAEFRALMLARHRKPQSLASRLCAETSGDDWHDLKLLLKGWPNSPQQWHDRVVATYRHERSGWFRRADGITREGPVMDRDVSELHALYAKASHHDPLTAEDALRIEVLARICLRDLAAFRATKNALASLCANVVAAGCTAAVVLGAAKAEVALHAGELHLVSVGLMVFGVSTLARFLVKRSLKGDGYSNEEAFRDLAFSSVDGIAPVLARFSPSALLRRALDMATKLGGKSAVGRIGRTTTHAGASSRFSIGRSDLASALAEFDTGLGPNDGESTIDISVEPPSAEREACSASHEDVPFEKLLNHFR